jgi:hypothetical protein
MELCTADKSIVKGKERIVSAIDDVSVDDSWYRVDAFDRALEQISEVKKMGYYSGPEVKDGNE